MYCDPRSRALSCLSHPYSSSKKTWGPGRLPWLSVPESFLLSSHGPAEPAYYLSLDLKNTVHSVYTAFYPQNIFKGTLRQTCTTAYPFCVREGQPLSILLLFHSKKYLLISCPLQGKRMINTRNPNRAKLQSSILQGRKFNKQHLKQI